MGQQEIEDLILISDAYSLELAEELFEEEKRSCTECCDVAEIMQLIVLKEQLLYKISISDYGTETGQLYACLLSAVANYSGASITVDPNASIPNTVIDVTIVGNDSPYEINFTWDEFIDNGLAGRIRYENPDWENWVPQITIGGIQLNYGLANYGIPDDFRVLTTGGFELLPTANVPAIYQSQLAESTGYRPYTGPPPIQVGIVLIDNQSSQAIQYNDNGAGLVSLPSGQQFFKNPIVNNQFVNIQLPVPSGTSIQVVYTAYNLDGSVFAGPVTTTRPPSTGIQINNMSITKRHVFIATST